MPRLRRTWQMVTEPRRAEIEPFLRLRRVAPSRALAPLRRQQ